MANPWASTGSMATVCFSTVLSCTARSVRPAPAVEQPQRAERLQHALRVRVASMDGREPARAPEAGAGEAMRALGYLSGASGKRGGTVDPKDGLVLLEEAKAAQRASSAREAV